MREIKFRGKIINSDKILNNKWIYGSLLIINKNYQKIRKYTQNSQGDMEYLECQVEPKTVGQYTGFKDENGKEIWKGDICKVNENSIGIIEFKDSCFFWTNNDEISAPLDFWWSIEVIGNIYDNLELLKEEK